MKKLLLAMFAIFALATVSCTKGAGSASTVDSTDTIVADSTDSVSADTFVNE